MRWISHFRVAVIGLAIALGFAEEVGAEKNKAAAHAVMLTIADNKSVHDISLCGGYERYVHPIPSGAEEHYVPVKTELSGTSTSDNGVPPKIPQQALGPRRIPVTRAPGNP